MESSEKILKLVLRLTYFSILVSLLPVAIFSFEYLFNSRTSFFKFSMLPGTFLMAVSPIVCIISSFLLIGLLNGRRKIFGVILFFLTVFWYLWFYNLIKNDF
jgi:hypothetical protein